MVQLSRRQVIAALAACGIATAGCRASGGTGAARATPTTRPGGFAGTGSPPPSAVAPGLLLARRFSFGPTADLRQLGEAGIDAYFDAQLAEEAELPEVLAIVEPLDARAVAPAGGVADPARRRGAAEAVVGRTLALSAWSGAQLRAVLADFFADHLHVTVAEAPEVFFMPSYDRDVIRAGALGRFRDLLVRSARSAAMLVYLDNARSRADGAHVPNENYGRELLELHTVGVDGGYDEADVVEVAHVLAGWSLRRGEGTFTFRAPWHDLGPLADGGDVLGWRPAARGEADGEDLLAHLAGLPATARFLSWKLARRFVGDHVAPDAALVDRLAEVYLASDTAVGPVVRELAASEEFSASGAAKLRRPLDAVAAMLRLGFEVPDPAGFERPARVAARQLQALGQLPYGWPAPNGYPETAGAWAGAGALIGRWNLASVAAGGFGGLTPRAEAAGSDPVAVSRALLGAEPGPRLVAALRGAPADGGRSARALTFASPEFQLR